MELEVSGRIARGRPRGVVDASFRRRWRWRRSREGVSDVVATILILVLTVVLFSTLFALVSRFPAPPAQSVDQFQASVVHTSTAITALNILQAGGPAVPSSDRVYLQSSRTSSDWQFFQANGIPVAWGIGNSSSGPGWTTGTYWTTTFGTSIKMPANITIWIVSSSQLLYSGVAPGVQPNVPPILTSTSTVPTTPGVGKAFQVVALVSGSTTNLSMNISLANVPGLPSTVQTMKANGSGEWVYNVSAGLTTTAGSYLAFIQGVNASGATIAGSVTVTLSGSSSGGSGSNLISVAVSLDPQPPPVPGPGTATALAAAITYTGSQSNVPVSVTFTVAQTRPVTGFWPSSDFQTTVAGPTGVTMSGPSTVTVFAPSTFSTWLLNLAWTYSTGKTGNSPVVYANVTLTGVGTATGSAVVGALATSLQALAYFTTSSSTTTSTSIGALETTFASCGTNSCPYLYMSFWNNYTSSISFSGTVWTNNSAGTAHTSYTISSTPVSAGSTATVNVVSAGSTTRWSLPTGGSTGTYYVRMWLTVTVSGTTVAYIFSSFQATYT